MALEMKKCKECGKLFTPKSKLSKYCDETHYRPCPVCQKLVVAKYLSDPARCCSGKCRFEFGKMNKEESTLNVESETIQTFAETITDDMKEEDSSNQEVIETVVELKLDAVSEITEASISLKYDEIKKYVGNTTAGFIKDHEYAVCINKEKGSNVYVITAVRDVTTDEPVDLMMTISSKSSYYRKFKSVK